MPKNNPTIAEKVIEPIMAPNGKAKGQSFRLASNKSTLLPITTPINQPITHNKTASIINCIIMA